MSHNITVEGGSAVRLPTAGKYCDQDIIVTATEGGVDTSDATATADMIFEGETAYVNGEKITGTFPDSEIDTQTELLDQIITSLEEKAAGGNTDIEDAIITRTISEYSNSRITIVGGYAFYGCLSLASIDLPNVKTISTYGFYNCAKLTDVYLPSATVIYSYGFYSCDVLTSVDCPELLEFGNYAFFGCTKLESVNTPKVTKIGSQAFYGCTALTEAVYSQCTSLGAYAFYNCTGITKVSFPKITSVGGQAFRSCTKLAEVDIPLCTTLNTYSFYGDQALSTIDLPKVTSVGANAFASCSTLRAVILRSTTMATLGATTAFTSTPIASGTGYIYVPESLLDSYKAATNWSTYADQIVAIEGSEYE